MAHRKRNASFQSADSLFLGTPVAISGRDDGAYVPEWQQEARDDQGRRRFHGAFTGGFSAGYYNTVGSKEGWTPSQYISSRKGGGVAQSFTPEDFMDEEDLADRRASETLVTSKSSRRTGELTVSLAESDDSTGYDLLKRMGWKPGFGIGPLKETVVEGRRVHLPPRRDTDMPALISSSEKVDLHGLGYGDTFQEKLPSLPSASTISSARKKPQKKHTGIGLGVLNDDGDDDDPSIDDDPYEIKPLSISDRHRLASKRAKRALAKSADTESDSSGKKLKTISTKKISLIDGRIALKGFIYGDEIALGDRNFASVFAPIQVPNSFVFGLLIQKDPTIVPQGHNLHSSNAENNSSSQTSKPGKSVFDFLTPAQRDRIASFTGKSDLPPAKSELIPTPTVKTQSNSIPATDVQDQIPRLDPKLAESALNNEFKPYSAIPSKQERYKLYLNSQLSNDMKLTVPQSMVHQEWISELREFHKSASLFKPLPSALASRFTSSKSSSSSDDNNAHKERLNQLKQAAAANMYGPLTRKTSPWTPARLLSKRFSLRQPQIADDSSATQQNLQQQKNFSIQDNSLLSDKTMHQLAESANVKFNPPQKVEVNTDLNPALEQPRAPKDLFEAIFGDD
ncbi:uncharacterized protein V1516DRAFT_619711 [Lipomyces oligophaga]|uniref:uncharacterized protein n=1 Tax=Lipomyces oligophaga TaxID=45792 RepID=UPI0034CE37C8